MIYSPMWAQGLLGTSALIGGATQIPGSVTDFLGSGSVAPMRKYLSPQKVIAVGIIMLVITFAMMVFAGVKAPYWVLLVAGASKDLVTALASTSCRSKSSKTLIGSMCRLRLRLVS